MNSLASKVQEIEGDLHNQRSQLQTIETNAKNLIGSEVQSVHTALTNCDSEILGITSQIGSCLAQIDYHSTSNEIDLKPQMTWLNSRLGDIGEYFGTAQSGAETALDYVNDYTYKTMDVGQEVEARRSQLARAETDAKALAQKAKEELAASERLLAASQAKIAEKEREIQTKTSEASAKRSKKIELESQVTSKNNRIREAERQREKKKDKAIISGGIGILGIVLAPVTAGASLALTVGGGIGVGVNASDASDLKDEIRAINSSISSLQSEISQAERDVSSLELEKRELQRAVTRCQSDVETRRREQRESQRQINTTNRIKREISTLDNHAIATTSTVAEQKGELQTIKQNLDSFSAVLKERSLEVETNAGFIERFLGKSYQRRREYERQLACIKNVAATLEDIHVKMPALLESQNTKLLGSSRPKTATETVIEIKSPIPDLHYI